MNDLSGHKADMGSWRESGFFVARARPGTFFLKGADSKEPTKEPTTAVVGSFEMTCFSVHYVDEVQCQCPICNPKSFHYNLGHLYRILARKKAKIFYRLGSES